MNARKPRADIDYRSWWLYVLSGAVTVVVEELYVVGSWNGSHFTVGYWLRSALADENGLMHPAALSNILDWIVVAALGFIAARGCRALAIWTGLARHPLPTDRGTMCVGYAVEAVWCAALPVPLMFFTLVSSGFVP